MQSILKLFGAKDSASFEKRFNRSLILLTIIYSVTLGVILLISASVSYSTFSFRVGERFEHFRQPLNEPVEIEIRRGPSVEEVQEDLMNSFIMVNGILLVIGIGLSYLLARITLKPLKDAYEDQRRFIADASHELRTPLSVMHIEIENEIEEAKHKKLSIEKLESNLDEVKRMTKIVQDLLYLSKLENSQTLSQTQVVNVYEVLDSIVKRLQTLAESKSVTLQLDTTHTNTEVFANDQVSHVFSNIIQNAIIYNKPEGTVHVAVSPKKNFVEIKIEDTGIGMSHTDLKHIFDRFYRADKSRSRAVGGSGLGLAIAQRIIESTDGSIHIESEIDKGTTVIVQIPKA